MEKLNSSALHQNHLKYFGASKLTLTVKQVPFKNSWMEFFIETIAF